MLHMFLMTNDLILNDGPRHKSNTVTSYDAGIPNASIHFMMNNSIGSHEYHSKEVLAVEAAIPVLTQSRVNVNKTKRNTSNHEWISN